MRDHSGRLVSKSPVNIKSTSTAMQMLDKRSSARSCTQMASLSRRWISCKWQGQQVGWSSPTRCHTMNQLHEVVVQGYASSDIKNRRGFASYKIRRYHLVFCPIQPARHVSCCSLFDC